MPLLSIISAVIAAFPPHALTVSHLDEPTFGGLFVAEQLDDFIFAIALLSSNSV
jgi:hypothetical protein